MDPQNNENYGGRGGAFGASGVNYENFDTQEPPRPEQPAGGIPINVINAVNANGVVSGKRVVDYFWKQLAVSILIVAGGCLIGLVAAIIMANNLNGKIAQLESEKTILNSNLSTIYDALGTDSQAGALNELGSLEVLNGGDLAEIKSLLAGKYGANYELDFGDANINSVQKTGAYKYVSLGVVRPGGTVRAILYERIADGRWVLSSFDSTNSEDACANMSESEKKAVSVLSVCNEVEEKSEENKAE